MGKLSSCLVKAGYVFCMGYPHAGSAEGPSRQLEQLVMTAWLMTGRGCQL